MFLCIMLTECQLFGNDLTEKLKGEGGGGGEGGCWLVVATVISMMPRDSNYVSVCRRALINLDLKIWPLSSNRAFN